MIKLSRPPNFEAIAAVFPLAAEHGVIFAYAPHIYVPGGQLLHPALAAHEAVHVARQADYGVEAWWDNYLVDVKFRFEEELLAHRAEYRRLIRDAHTPQRRLAMRELVARKLSAPLYGPMITYEKALQELR